MAGPLKSSQFNRLGVRVIDSTLLDRGDLLKEIESVDYRTTQHTYGDLRTGACAGGASSGRRRRRQARRTVQTPDP